MVTFSSPAAEPSRSLMQMYQHEVHFWVPLELWTNWAKSPGTVILHLLLVRGPLKQQKDRSYWETIVSFISISDMMIYCLLRYCFKIQAITKRVQNSLMKPGYYADFNLNKNFITMILYCANLPSQSGFLVAIDINTIIW